MKKAVYIILFLSYILNSYAQNRVNQNNYQIWYTATDVNFDDGNERKEDFEGWRECNIRVLREKRIVKIFTENTLTFIGLEERFERTESNDAIYMEKKCMDGDGTECTLTFMHSKNDGLILLWIRYKNYSVTYRIVPDE